MKASMVVETRFFSAKVVNLNDSQLIVDVRRRIPCLPGLMTELIELLSPVLNDAENASESTLVAVPVDDPFLFRDFQAIGFSFIGYLQSGTDAEQFVSTVSLWGQDEIAVRLVGVSEAHESCARGQTNIRVLLQFIEKLCHDHTYGAELFLSQTRQFERTLYGVTSVAPELHQETSPRKPRPAVSTTPQRSLCDFQEVVARRQSASRLSLGPCLTKATIETLLCDSFWVRENGTQPFACAGGIGDYDIHFSVKGIPDMSDGLYCASSDLQEITLCKEGASWNELLWKASHSQLFCEYAPIFFVIVSNSERITRKYGCRSYRYSLVDVGGLLQNLHLSAASLKLGFRAIGGFDDKLVSSFLQLAEDQFPLIMAAAGQDRLE